MCVAVKAEEIVALNSGTLLGYMGRLKSPLETDAGFSLLNDKRIFLYGRSRQCPPRSYSQQHNECLTR